MLTRTLLHKRAIPKLLACALLVAAATAVPAQNKFGIFDTHQDVGQVLHPGSAQYDPASGTYTITGNGENMWGGRDDFHFAWTRMSGDVALSGDIAFTSEGGNPHRKAVLDIRESLNGPSKSVDIARHGDGLTSLQFRDASAADTHEVESNLSAPQHVRIVKRGDFVYAFVSGPDGVLRPSGAATHIAFSGPFYIGIGVCSHDKDASVTARFSNVTLTRLPVATGKPVLFSALETSTIASTDRHVEYVAPTHFNSPTWNPDGSSFVFEQDGKPYKLPLHGASLLPADAEPQPQKDSGLSPDGQWKVLVDPGEGTGAEREVTLKLMSMTDQKVHTLATFLGDQSTRATWSPDSKKVAFISYELISADELASK